MNNTYDVIQTSQEYVFPGDEKNNDVYNNVEFYVNKVRNTDITIIEILEERLIVYINDYISGLRIKSLLKISWTIFFTILPIILTAEFSRDYIIKAIVWKYIFHVIMIISLCLGIITGCICIAKHKDFSVQSLIDKIKNKKQTINS